MSDSYDESLSNVRIITKYFLLRRNKHLSCKSQLLIIMKNNLRNFSRIVLFTIMSRKNQNKRKKYSKCSMFVVWVLSTVRQFITILTTHEIIFFIFGSTKISIKWRHIVDISISNQHSIPKRSKRKTLKKNSKVKNIYFKKESN